MRVGALWFRNPKMAQAARLNLRMQKELKLLLSDPPPGASFPFLSPDAAAAASPSSSSLTAIDAEIQGPEGTVYAGGIFTIRIQIPERYPFQPPIVTFATPIYHPNIDTGGRICLDILNLPPKGAWQPSLNISTVITSFGLLLSEPNPDDGLMCEASREFKYNRQAFDLKARTMTEKYAKASSRMVSSCQGTQQTVELRSTGDIEAGDEIKAEDSSCVVNTSKPLGMCKKLLPDLSISHRGKDTTGKANEMTHPVLPIIESKKTSEPEESIQKLKRVDEVHITGGSSFFKKKKLSLSLLNPPKQSEIDNENRPVDQQVPSYSSPAKIQSLNGNNMRTSQVSNCNLQEHDTASKEKVFTTYENCKRSTGSKRLSLGFSIMCRNHDQCKNENIMPIRKLSEKPLEISKENVPSNLVRPEFAKQAGLSEGSGVTEINKKSGKAEQLLAKKEVEYLHDHKRDDCKLLLQPEDPSLSDHKSCSFLHQRGCTDGFQSSIDRGRDATQNKQQPDPLSVIVLDSDESDQEEISRCRTKLSLLSRRPSRGNNKERKAFVRATTETSS